MDAFWLKARQNIDPAFMFDWRYWLDSGQTSRLAT